MNLTIVSGPERGRSFSLQPGQNIIGRAEDCQVQLAAHGISRRHACVVLESNRIRVEDLGSSNGTFVNGQRIAQPVELRPGMTFQIGEFSLGIDGGGALPRAGADLVSRPGAAIPTGGTILPGVAAAPEPVFWTIYSRLAFLGWRGQASLVLLLGLLLVIGGAVYPLVVQHRSAMLRETIKQGEMIAQRLALKNGEYVRNRQETSLDVSASEPGVIAAFILSRDLRILAPLEQVGRPRVNALSREAAVGNGVFVRESTEIEGDENAEPGTYHIAVPIKVRASDRPIEERYGVAYIIYRAGFVAESSSSAGGQFIFATVMVLLVFAAMMVLLFMLTNRPIHALHEDAELVLRGDLRQVEPRARWRELEQVAASMNRAFERGRQAAQAAAHDAGTELGGGMAAVPAFAPSTGPSIEDAKVEAVANAVQDAVIITNEMQRVLYLNQRGERLFNVPLQAARGRHIMELGGNHEVVGVVLDLFSQVMQSGQPLAARRLTLNELAGPRELDVVVSGVRGSGGQLEYAAVVIR